jgi:hypothetical protein
VLTHSYRPSHSGAPLTCPPARVSYSQSFGERLAPLGSQSYCLGTTRNLIPESRYAEPAQYARYPTEYYSSYGGSYYERGGSIVNPPPRPAPPPLAPAVQMGHEETWVWKQAEASRRRHRDEQNHVRAVMAALISQRQEAEAAAARQEEPHTLCSVRLFCLIVVIDCWVLLSEF